MDMYDLDNLPYARGVLHALEQIGDKHDLREIEILCQTAFISEEFHAVVQQCADTIRERLAREDSKGILLRADCKPEAVATLLRPSTENADTPPQQLLRAAKSDEENMPV